MPSWISISLEIVCNPFKSQFVRHDSRSFMNTAKQKEVNVPLDVHHCYIIYICCFSAMNAALRRKSKDWLAWKSG